VRETWREGQYAVGRELTDADRISYRATFVGEPARKWRPSIFMPRWASRLTLEVEGARVERLQAITEADILAEGVTVDRVAAWTGIPWSDLPTLHDAWAAGWNHINGRRPGARWEDDPWVWVTTFRVLDGAA
jgi:hypothetical protein